MDDQGEAWTKIVNQRDCEVIVLGSKLFGLALEPKPT